MGQIDVLKMIDQIDVLILQGISSRLSLREIALTIPMGRVRLRLNKLERSGYVTRQKRKWRGRMLTATGKDALENPGVYLRPPAIKRPTLSFGTYSRSTGVLGTCRTCGKTKMIAAKNQCYGCYQADRRRRASLVTQQKDTP